MSNIFNFLEKNNLVYLLRICYYLFQIFRILFRIYKDIILLWISLLLRFGC